MFLISYQNTCTFLDCNQPHTLSGANCHAYLIRYHWNNALQRCEKVIYGGCRETQNNFESLEDCDDIARPICLQF